MSTSERDILQKLTSPEKYTQKLILAQELRQNSKYEDALNILRPTITSLFNLCRNNKSYINLIIFARIERGICAYYRKEKPEEINRHFDIFSLVKGFLNVTEAELYQYNVNALIKITNFYLTVQPSSELNTYLTALTDNLEIIKNKNLFNTLYEDYFVVLSRALGVFNAADQPVTTLKLYDQCQDLLLNHIPQLTPQLLEWNKKNQVSTALICCRNDLSNHNKSIAILKNALECLDIYQAANRYAGEFNYHLGYFSHLEGLEFQHYYLAAFKILLKEQYSESYYTKMIRNALNNLLSFESYEYSLPKPFYDLVFVCLKSESDGSNFNWINYMQSNYFQLLSTHFLNLEFHEAFFNFCRIIKQEASFDTCCLNKKLKQYLSDHAADFDSFYQLVEKNFHKLKEGQEDKQKLINENQSLKIEINKLKRPRGGEPNDIMRKKLCPDKSLNERNSQEFENGLAAYY